jgi:hypothetical protein
MRYSQEFLRRWLITAERFERWVNVLADNDDAPVADVSPRPQEIPAVSSLSFY